MLQLSTSNLDIIKVSKILAKFKINASTSKTGIILSDGEISEELVNALITSGIEINSVRNFIAETDDSLFEDNSLNIDDDKTSSEYIINDGSHRTKIPVNCKKYDLLFPTVKRGEVYICDFGEPYGSEQGYIRYSIIIQNDIGNIHSPTTIVLNCSTRNKNKLPVHRTFKFSEQNMIDYDVRRIGTKKNIIMAEQIHTVDKSRLRKYLGTMTSDFMDDIQEIIYNSIGSKRNV